MFVYKCILWVLTVVVAFMMCVSYGMIKNSIKRVISIIDTGTLLFLKVTLAISMFLIGTLWGLVIVSG